MIQIQVEGSNKAIADIAKRKMLMFTTTRRIIVDFGDRLVESLGPRFKDLTFSGQFFPKNMEYWITISRMGKKLTYIRCPTSNLFYTKERNSDGSQDFKSDVKELDSTLDVPKLVDQITNSLSRQINIAVRRIWK